MPYKDPEVARQKAKERQRKYREKNKEKLRIKHLGRYHALYKNDEEAKKKNAEYGKKWRAENRDKIIAYRRDPENLKKANERSKAWQKCNKGKVRARNRMRKKHVKEATPPWINRELRQWIYSFYETATILEDTEGIKYHVDHIVPLVNDRVCGLHVPWNLRVIPASENLKKGNKF